MLSKYKQIIYYFSPRIVASTAVRDWKSFDVAIAKVLSSLFRHCSKAFSNIGSKSVFKASKPLFTTASPTITAVHLQIKRPRPCITSRQLLLIESCTLSKSSMERAFAGVCAWTVPATTPCSPSSTACGWPGQWPGQVRGGGHRRCCAWP